MVEAIIAPPSAYNGTNPSFENVLDSALDELRAGEDIENICAKYPDHAQELEPLLNTAQQVRQAALSPLSFAPELKQKGLESLLQAVEERRQNQPS